MINYILERCYNELITLETFEDRFNYLKLNGEVGSETFGCLRHLNQTFYRSVEWKDIRREIIIRDNGNDLSVEGHPIFGQILVHHINPITVDDIIHMRDNVFDPNNLICVSKLTHNALHYGNIDILPKDPVVRTKNDTCPWKR